MTAIDVDPSLAASLERASSLLEWHDVQAGWPSGEGWMPCDDLLVGGGAELDRWLGRIAARSAAPPETAASYLLGFYTEGVVSAAAALLLAERRVPDISPGNLSLHRNAEQWVDRSALHGPVVAVLPGDPLAGRPGVTVVSDVDGLRRHLVAALLTHVAPIVDAVRSRARLGLRVRWGLVADAVAGAFLEAGNGLGDQPRARDEADAILDLAPGTLRARPAWLEMEHCGQCRVFMRRSACCLAYKTPDHGYCTSCPSTPDAERVQRLRDYLSGARS